MKNLNIIFDLLLFPFLFLMRFQQNQWKRSKKISFLSLFLIFSLPLHSAINSCGQIIVEAECSNSLTLYSLNCHWDATASPKHCLDGSAPIADAGTDQTLTLGDDITLDGSGSTDSDGTISSYSWNDGTTTWTGVNNTIIGGLPVGTHTFTLTVTDNDGATGTDTVTITVSAAGGLPTISIAGASIIEGNTGDTTILNFTVTLSAVAPAGGVTVDYTTTDGSATAGLDYTASIGTLTIGAGNANGTISVTIITGPLPETDETFTVTLSNPTNATLGTATATGIIIDDDTISSGSCPIFTPEFSLDINGTEDNITGLSGGPDGFTGSTDDRYWEFNATAAGGEDINGTLRVVLYASNFNEICNIELLDENCQIVTNYSWTNTKGKEFSIFVDTDKTYYLHIDDLCGNNPQVIVAMLWYPNYNGTGGGGGFNYNEPAIFRGTDYVPSGGVFDNTQDFVRTKIVNKEHDLTVSIVKDDGTIFTGYKGSFQFELVDATNYGTDSCSQLPSVEYYGVLGMKSNDNGIMTTGDNTTEHGPHLIYNKAVKNVKYRMRYLIDNADGGIINYQDLINFNGCVGNKQSCLWGVLTSMASNGQDPYLPEYTIADVCGLYCDPGTGAFGTGNNQISKACADCVFGPGYSDCSNSFAIRPDKFDVNITNTTPPFKAGKDYDLLFRAPDYTDSPSTGYNQTQEVLDITGTTFYVDLNVSNNIHCPIKELTITPTVNFIDGIHQDDFSFDDIGDINMSIHETNTTEFAIIDADDTPLKDTLIAGELIDGRLIKEHNISFRVIPDHFNIDANLTDHNSDNNFTYLHDINKYNTSDDNHSMGAELNISIQAMNEDDTAVTTNYIKGCYAKDTNLTLTLGGNSITYPGTIPALTKFIYYNPLEDNATNDGEGEHNFTTPITSPISIASLPIENIDATFPVDTDDDGTDDNGTTFIEYKLNFDRKLNLVVNPFKMSLNGINIIDEDSVTETGGTVTITDKNATMYYARTRASKFFYEDIIDSWVRTPIAVDVYCDLGFVTGCPNMGIETDKAQIDEMNWWLSLGHDMDREDGNITVEIGAITDGPGAPKLKNATVESDTLDLNITSLGKDNNVSVVGHTISRPMIVEIDLVTDDTLTSYTNAWLIYNKESATVPTPFYKVEFINEAGWTGVGETGNVIDNNASSTKTKRLNW